MNTYQIYADKTVSITEARKNINGCFIDEPVAVLSNNKPTGYMISADLFEQIVNALNHGSNETKLSSFRPSKDRYNEIINRGMEALKNCDVKDLEDFTE